MAAVTETKTKKSMEGIKAGKSRFDVRSLTIIGMLSALAAVLMLFEVPLWFAPSFYQIDLSEVPVLIGSFALGPVAGILIELVKILLNFMMNGTATAGIGEAANFLIGCSFMLPASIIYHRKRTKKAALAGLIIGTAILTTVGCIINAYVLLPTYAGAFHVPLNELVKAGAVLNKNITGLGSFIMLAVAPFNLLKGAVSSILTILLYKKISNVLKKNY